MKFSYSQKLDKYVVTELGRLIDSDEDGIALGVRHGFFAQYANNEDLDDLLRDEEQEELLLEADDDNDLLHDFGALPDFDAIAAAQPAIEVRGHEDQIFDFDTALSGDDDLAVIREFLED
jgi:hypothetical protein